MKFQNEAINDYCVQHSAVPSQDCEALADYTRANVPMSMMVSGAQVTSLLGFLIRTTGAKRVLEVGCYTGYSALAMAENLPKDGEVVTLDIDPETNKLAKEFWAKSPHGSKITSLLGPASETFKKLKGPFDFVFIDADKPGYATYLNLALELLSPKGIIACDNVLFSGQILDADPKDENGIAMKKFNEVVMARTDINMTMLPIRDGVYLISKKS